MERRTKTCKLTAVEGEKYRRMREEIEQEKPEIARRARAYKAVVALIAQLKAERGAKGMSLADVRDLTGMDRAALSRLENGVRENPSVETLARYADAVGCELVLRPSK